ncbi:hypothetical protein DDE01_02040 [Desulfovibrio desulfuricans]|uniref:Uncharacterized protein n=1 Tax=Nitratidesulfovibrio vulgaris (strain DP4) TaxID=391774 RepID=A0A0H3A6L5_NITV4|nr:hypothetical protein Dvul_0071 [Nitratidesulfovibrio vulgaris DP4]GEB78789.1 hypothetical protein DDE01_02040 [Desulfovibrio desulfuricans]
MIAKVVDATPWQIKRELRYVTVLREKSMVRALYAGCMDAVRKGHVDDVVVENIERVWRCHLMVRHILFQGAHMSAVAVAVHRRVASSTQKGRKRCMPLPPLGVADIPQDGCRHPVDN